MGCAFNTVGSDQLHSTSVSDHRNGHIDAQVTIICKQLGNAGVKYKTVRIHDCRGDPFMDGSWCCFPCQTSSLPIQF